MKKHLILIIFYFLVCSNSFAADISVVNGSGWKRDSGGDIRQAYSNDTTHISNLAYESINNWDTAVATVTKITSVHDHDIGDDVCMVTQCPTDNTLISIEECFGHVEGPEIHFEAEDCIDPQIPAGDSSMFIGYDVNGLVRQGTEFTSAQKRLILPIVRIQAKIGQKGPGSEISDRGILDLRPMGSEFEWRFFRWVKDAIGTLFVRGGFVTENIGTDRQLDISTGTFFDGEIFEETFPQYSNITGIVLLHSPLGNWSTLKPISVLQVDNVNVDSATGLVAMSNNTKWSNTTILLSPEGIDGRAKPRFFLIYSPQEYDSQSEAEEAGAYYGPFIDEATSRLVAIASAIQNKNAANITNIVDRRPVVGAGGGSISGASDFQSVYNGSIIPQVTTDITRGAVTLKDGGSGIILNLTDSDDNSAFNVTSSSVTFLENIAIFQDQKPSGTLSGSCSAGNYIARDLTTTVIPASFANLSGTNKILIQPGTYFINANPAANRTEHHKAKLIDAVGLSDIIVGSSGYAEPTAVWQMERSPIIGRFSTSAPTFVKIVHRCAISSSGADWGLANSFGEVEIYLTLIIRKER